jgi:hypothetical protein
MVTLLAWFPSPADGSASIESMEGANVEAVELAPEILNLATELGVGIAVLPLDVVGGKGVYSEPSVMLVKELRSLGADAAYAHPSELRVFEVRKSAEALLAAFVIGIASSASWDLMKSLLDRWREAHLSVTFVELEHGHGRRGTAWKVDGDADSVIRAIDALRERSTSPGETSDGE